VAEPDAWSRFAAELAAMPDVIERLMREHVADGSGHCRACTTPGRGTPASPWPCGLFAIARYAHLRREGENHAL
jgi:hypothetical protein